ncbi:MAG: epoxyqueuosine reductase QueH [Oscillospiraceae bacterium]|nr:epoxyqueuosine reductase QueH [Oscillospiraceae bacterium]
MMKQNYQKQMDAVVVSLPQGERPRLLLQSCCGPCSSYVLEALTPYFRVTVLYYNPNIQPRAEYDLRLENQRKIIAALPTPSEVDILECDYDGEKYDAAVKGLESEPEGGARCTVCFRLRLEETAKRASKLGYDFFCTTLTVSPHKDAERLNQIGRALGERYGVPFLPSDFKKREGYKRSIQLSKEYDLYRQDYCGCLFSKPVDNSAAIV